MNIGDLVKDIRKTHAYNIGIITYEDMGVTENRIIYKIKWLRYNQFSIWFYGSELTKIG